MAHLPDARIVTQWAETLKVVRSALQGAIEPRPETDPFRTLISDACTIVMVSGLDPAPAQRLLERHCHNHRAGSGGQQHEQHNLRQTMKPPAPEQEAIKAEESTT